MRANELNVKKNLYEIHDHRNIMYLNGLLYGTNSVSHNINVTFLCYRI